MTNHRDETVCEFHIVITVTIMITVISIIAVLLEMFYIENQHIRFVALCTFCVHKHWNWKINIKAGTWEVKVSLVQAKMNITYEHK